VGVGRWGTMVPRRTTPHPDPPPQGGRESTRLWQLTPMREGATSPRKRGEVKAAAKCDSPAHMGGENQG
jgi:hypothetical protein